MAKVVINPVCADVTINGIPLNAINLNLAKAVYNYLIQVLPKEQIILTRTDSTVCPLDSTQTKAIANATDVQLVVNIGVDTFDDTTVSGMEIFHAGNNADSLTFANSMFNSTANLRTKWDINARFGGAAVLTTYYMLTGVNKPSILIMPGFFSNTKDFNILVNYDFQKEFGFAVAQDMASHLGLGTIQQNPVTLPTIPVPDSTTIKSYAPWIVGIAGLGLIAILIFKGKKR